MVVDGFIDGTKDIATIKLTYATALADSKEAQKLSGARVWIEDEQQNKTNLSETAAGIYTSSGASFATGNKYQLHVDRGTNVEYHSDYVELLPTPPIDSVTWEADDLDVAFFVNTHDPDNKINFFKWDFLETYEYTSPIQSKYKVINGEVVFSPGAESNSTCWQTLASQDVLTTSVERLTDKVVYRYPIYRLAGDDLKLWWMYSMIVRQTSLEKTAYTFWSNLKETTENLGGLFDAMPAEVRGNIHSSDPNDLVLGYFYASEVSEKRIFIAFYDLPDPILRIPRIRDECVTWNISVPEVKHLEEHTLVIKPLTDLRGNLIGYEVGTDRCIDCRVYRKGTLQRPDFWPAVSF